MNPEEQRKPPLFVACESSGGILRIHIDKIHDVFIAKAMNRFSHNYIKSISVVCVHPAPMGGWCAIYCLRNPHHNTWWWAFAVCAFFACRSMIGADTDPLGHPSLALVQGPWRSLKWTFRWRATPAVSVAECRRAQTPFSFL